MSDLFVESWGLGTRAVLVHGSLATGADEWQAQRPLADEGFQLLVLDRRGYGKSPALDGEDFVRGDRLIREQYVAWKLVDRTLSLLHVGRSVCIPT